MIQAARTATIGSATTATQSKTATGDLFTMKKGGARLGGAIGGGHGMSMKNEFDGSFGRTLETSE